MSEWDWITGTNPRVLLSFLRGRISERKRRLFACACCRLVRHLLIDERSWEAVLLAERYADGLATVAELSEAADVANQIHLDMDDRVRRLAAEAAFRCTVDYPEELWQLDHAWSDAALATEGYEIERTSNLSSEDTARMLDSWAEAWGGSGEPVGWTDVNSEAEMATILRDIFGNPFRPVTFNPAWRSSDVVALARGIYDDRAFDRMPILADALQDAGSDNDDVLNHCRDTNQPHARGCWVVDLILDKS